MNVTVSPAPTISPASPQSQQAGAEASCPVGMLTLFAGAVLWLLVASLLGLRTSLNFHAPTLFAGHGYFSYGRVHAAQNAALLYGNGLGGLQLQVSPKDEEDARSILNDPGPPDGEVKSVS